MIFDDTVANEGTWFEFFESFVDPQTNEVTYLEVKPGAAEFCIRSTQPFWEERLKTRKKEQKSILNPKTRQMEIVSMFVDSSVEENLALSDDATDYAITGVRGAYWPSKKDPSKRGDAIQTTREDKLRLNRVPQFQRFFRRCQELLDTVGVRYEAEKKEAEDKNL